MATLATRQMSPEDATLSKRTEADKVSRTESRTVITRGWVEAGEEQWFTGDRVHTSVGRTELWEAVVRIIIQQSELS